MAALFQNPIAAPSSTATAVLATSVPEQIVVLEHRQTGLTQDHKYVIQVIAECQSRLADLENPTALEFRQTDLTRRHEKAKQALKECQGTRQSYWNTFQDRIMAQALNDNPDFSEHYSQCSEFAKDVHSKFTCEAFQRSAIAIEHELVVVKEQIAFKIACDEKPRCTRAVEQGLEKVKEELEELRGMAKEMGVERESWVPAYRENIYFTAAEADDEGITEEALSLLSILSIVKILKTYSYARL
ncbi:hypothetical protein CC86DRAFT_386336 [Ophiobolus disseminans]|uniref:Uncharacterized protein n=1 Tax=Ophiobolus disseminans TaxID=1469910 RepID=A0A6A6ZK97_9PLEO|nr:hypothetical protein CC86DRAFT_386336 [Ophiobolus disseminans]